MWWGNQRHYLWGLAVEGGQGGSGQPHLPTGELRAKGKRSSACAGHFVSYVLSGKSLNPLRSSHL